MAIIPGKEIAQAISATIRKHLDIYGTSVYIGTVTRINPSDGNLADVLCGTTPYQNLPKATSDTITVGMNVVCLKAYGCPMMIVGQLQGNTQINVTDYTVGT